MTMNGIPLSYIVRAVVCAVSVATFNHHLSSQFKLADDVAYTKSTNVGESVKNKTLFEERWNLIKEMSCPKQVPNPSIWPTLFTQARIELGFDMDTIPNTTKDVDFVNAFFSFCNGGVGYTSLDGEHHLVYLKIWKSANDQIRKNIDLVTRNKNNLWEFDLGMNVIRGQRNPDYHELWSSIPLSKRNQPCVVTAVRDPVEHFLSAYNEIEFRSTDSWRRAHGINNHDKTQRYHEQYGNGTDARFERYAGALWRLEQQKPLMGVNAPRLVAYLPSISNISARFPNLVATNCPGFEEEFGRPFNKQFDHSSQKDEKGFYAAAKRVWSKQNATARALCALHLMDYACFDLIPVPNLCQDVFSDESFHDRLRGATAPSSTSAKG